MWCQIGDVARLLDCLVFAFLHTGKNIESGLLLPSVSSPDLFGLKKKTNKYQA
jgi:hypothetical protein